VENEKDSVGYCSMKRKRYSRLFAGSKQTRRAFNLRKDFLNEMEEKTNHSNLFDPSLFPYYGRVDNDGNLIYPSETHLMPIKGNTKNSTDTVYALNFVVDAFIDLQNHFEKARQAGILDNRPNNISRIQAVKGWESMHKGYETNIRALYEAIVTSYLEKPVARIGVEYSRPEDFDAYMKSIRNIYLTKGKRFPLTRSAYLMSKRSSIHYSGLVIEVSPVIDYSDDVAKAYAFLDSPNYDFYMQSLRKFGFMADKDYPGRIIADLGSPKMQNYMEYYELTLENIFDELYYKAKDYDYELLRVYLVQLYNNYSGVYPVKSEKRARSAAIPASKYYLEMSEFYLREEPSLAANRFRTGKCLSTTVLKERYPLLENDLLTKYNDDYWLPVYAEFLNYELGSPLNKIELAKTIKNAKDLKKNVDFDTAIGYIGDKFNFYRHPANLSLVNYKNPAQQASNYAAGGSGGGY
jgi:hypothetical protein